MTSTALIASETVTARTFLFAVMKVHKWEVLTAHGLPLQCPPEGPQGFIPVFDTRAQAVEWDGSDEHVVEMVIR